MTRTPLDLSLALQPRIAGAAEPSGACPAGPGWFESSWDLRRGLEVRESGDADARLRSWIEDFLGGGQAGASGSAAGVSFRAP
jgi:hypothetical protein